MRQASAAFKAKCAGNPTLVRLWEIVVPCKPPYRFTDNTQNIFYAGKLWAANPGIEISAIRRTVADGLDDATIKFPIDPEFITEQAIRYNELSGSNFSIIAVHFDAPELGHIELFAGRLGEATIEGEQATVQALANVKSIGNLLIGEVYSERCRNVIYDNRCKVDPKKYRVRFEVTGVDPDGRFLVSINLPENPEDEAENQEVITSVEEAKFEPDFLTNGLTQYSYTVPEGTIRLEVDLSSGAGGSTIYYIRKNKSTTLFRGSDGFPTTFLGVTAPGAGHGGVELRPGTFYGAGPVLPPEVVVTGADTFDNSGARSFDFGVTPQILDSPHDGFPSYGGFGAHGFKRYSVGQGKDLAVGQVINFSVGSGGVLVRDELIANSNMRLRGYPGWVRIRAVKGEIKTIERAKPENDWDYGSFEWEAGANACRTSVIRDITNGKVTLLVNPGRPIKVGDVGWYRPGCTNYRSCCIEKFNNLPNFRAEPDVPNIVAKTLTIGDTDAPVAAEQINITNPDWR